MIIISAHRSELDKTTNANRQSSLLAELLDVLKWNASVRPGMGSYNGVEEECFVIKAGTTDNERIQEISKGIYDLAERYDQDAIGAICLENLTMTTIYTDGSDSKTCELNISTDKPDGDYLFVGDRYYSQARDISDDLEIYAIIVGYQE